MRQKDPENRYPLRNAKRGLLLNLEIYGSFVKF